MMNSTARAHLVQLDAEVVEHLGGDAVALTDQTEKEVLGPNVVVVEALRLLLRQAQDFARALGEFVELVVHLFPPSTTEGHPAALGLPESMIRHGAPPRKGRPNNSRTFVPE